MHRSYRGTYALTVATLAGTILAASSSFAQTAPDGVARVADGRLAPAARPASPFRGLVIRGQSPDRQGKTTKLVSHEGAIVENSVPSTPYPGPYGCPTGNCPTGNCPQSYGPQYGQQYGQGYGNCPPGNCPPGYGDPNCPHGCPGGMGMFGHQDVNNYSYRGPNMPVYPAGTGPNLSGPGTPGAVVQYPYYTTKGPDDFFHDQDGKY